MLVAGVEVRAVRWVGEEVVVKEERFGEVLRVEERDERWRRLEEGRKRIARWAKNAELREEEMMR
jgi:hypothetical protein